MHGINAHCAPAAAPLAPAAAPLAFRHFTKAFTLHETDIFIKLMHMPFFK